VGIPLSALIPEPVKTTNFFSIKKSTEFGEVFLNPKTTSFELPSAATFFC
jgi:hypothetical protein